MSKPILLDLGCGKDKFVSSQYKTIGIDIWIRSNADLIASCLSLPFKDGSIDRIYARHFFEHFAYEQLVAILGECSRVLKPSGGLEMIVPHYSCVTAFLDPTHRMFFAKRTFDKLTPFGFQPVEFQFHWFREPYRGNFPFVIRLMNKFINRYPNLERFFGLIGGAYEVRCVLEDRAELLDLQHTDGAKIAGSTW